jgi:hypothetical protein
MDPLQKAADSPGHRTLRPLLRHLMRDAEVNPEEFVGC